MNQQVKRFLRRASAAFGALGLGTALTVVSLLSPAVPKVHAFPLGGQIQSRAIYMSTSIPSATGQSYLVTFKPASAAAIKGLILDFCAESPIIGDSNCTSPDSAATTPTFTVGGATPTVTFAGTSTGAGDPITTTGLPAATGSWTTTGLNNVGGKYRTLKLTNTTGNSGALDNSGATTYSFLLTGVTNPAEYGSPLVPHSFYARIITYTDSATDIATYAPGNESASGGSTDALDYGGYALSTTNSVNITAKVQETLSFCVVSTDPNTGGNTCGDAAFVSGNLPNLSIGHGTPPVIDNTAVDTSTAYMQVSTNASTGAVIRMHAGNSCANAGLSSNGGASCAFIPGVDNTATNAVTIVSGTPTFGLYVGNGYLTGAIATSTGTINASLKYHDPAHTTEGASNPDLFYGMDNTANSGVTGTYGSVIADTNSLPCNTVNAHLVFAATAGLTTPAGIYTGSESLIATGTF